ncbi:hypothetical protein CI109_107021 [Kwoniella shandongensis]|uniref:Uncharacterized protein n=1 Tax=Kwoniella shandongensis TaxID=1734106 RepID=A0A5M6BTJ4_9TREE|nr:uncharacterized protein CI109_007322 [Kwoniella shandongensis]KAA5524339.1 hypothetical protein CI109_007322 [Kwoniella shandongensis]
MSKTAPLEDESDPTYTHFAHRNEFLILLHRFLSLDICSKSTTKDEEEEEILVTSLGGILDYYLPLPGLLDPSLDEIVPPLMEQMENSLHILAEQEEGDRTKQINPGRLERLGRVLNWVVKVRGWKAVVPHFPSSIHNLSILVTLLSPPTSPSSSTTPSTPHHPLISSSSAWELRAVLLLWLALLLTVPFNLTALSSSDPVSTASYGIDLPSSSLLFSSPTAELAQRVILLSIPLLNRPGKEGAYSALVLARLFSREDAVHGLNGFFNWAQAEIHDGEREAEANLVASLFELLSSLPQLLKTQHLPILEEFTDGMLLPHLRGSRTAAGSGLIRKLAVKAKGRLWLAKIGKSSKTGSSDEDEEVDLPEGIEEELDDLMGGLSDKDTIVRYSCAKYLARLSALLPSSLSSQIVLATISLFSGTEDEPVTTTSFGTIIDPGGSASSGGTMGFGGLETTRGEARWHGVCLALAEMARRGLLEGEAVEGAVEWVVKALTFDLRRASHSIGANVRDAAAYLLWSLSRACPPKAIAPYAEDMATSLICVAVFDREVGVRRAASAAFQEGVGRLELYPEGIDVLAKTDFYSVSVRRMAFTAAAPAVAVHKVYRDTMREHLHHITLRHWDSAMRIQGAAALKSVLELGDKSDVEGSLRREVEELPSLDAVNVHGALLALTQLASLFSVADDRRHQIINALSTIRPAALVAPQAADILSTICSLFTVIVNPDIMSSTSTQAVLDKYLDLATKRRESEVHERVAEVYQRITELKTCEREVNKLVGDLKSFRVSQRQAASLALGHIRYPAGESLVTDKAVKALLSLLDDPTSSKVDVESRRWGVRSLGDIVVQRSNGMLVVSPVVLTAILKAILAALNDYTTDQRGDVGSWVRIASLNALGRVISNLEPPTNLVDATFFESIVGGIIKQSVEKLESVRAEAALALASLNESGWSWGAKGKTMVRSVKLLQDGGYRYIDQKEWFGGMMPFLEGKFRPKLLAGLVHSVGSQVVPLSQAAFQPLLGYLKAHPGFVMPVLQDLSLILAENYASNRVFIPTLQTAHKLFSSRALDLLSDAEDTAQISEKILAIGCKGLGSIKSIERITAAMRLVFACLATESSAKSKAVDYVALFLTHRFPRIRAMASEEMYLALSEMDDEMNPELEEVLLETDWVGQGVEKNAERVVELLRGG